MCWQISTGRQVERGPQEGFQMEWIWTIWGSSSRGDGRGGYVSWTWKSRRRDGRYYSALTAGKMPDCLRTSGSLEVSAGTSPYIWFRTTCKPQQEDGHTAGVKTFSWMCKETTWLCLDFGEGKNCTKAGCPTARTLNISSCLVSLGRNFWIPNASVSPLFYCAVTTSFNTSLNPPDTKVEHNYWSNS